MPMLSLNTFEQPSCCGSMGDEGMIEKVVLGSEIIVFQDEEGYSCQVESRNNLLGMESMLLDRLMTEALVERLRLWLATGSLHKEPMP